MKVLCFSILFLLCSCSHFGKKNHFPPEKPVTTSFYFKDKNGEYSFEKKLGISKNKKNLILKTELLSADGVLLEESSTISTFGKINGVSILRPLKSRFKVWFDKKEYQNEMTLNLSTKKLDVHLVSPEDRFSGTRSYSFPKSSSGVFCFYSQLAECVRITEFFKMAIDKDAGVMNFHLIWDNFPYTQELYTDMSNQIFEAVSLEYEGKNEREEYKFSLQLPNQIIFYFVDKNGELLKTYWIAQTLSIIRKDLKIPSEDDVNAETDSAME